MILFVAIVVGACSEAPATDRGLPTIAFLHDGAPPDADLVSGAALAGLELAAGEARGVAIEPVDVGEEPEMVRGSLRAIGDDRRVVAAVVAPWTVPPPFATELLAAEGLPVVTLSWAWGPPTEGPWRSLAVGRAQEAVALLDAAGALVPEGSRLCLAGDDHPTSSVLLATAERLGEAAGDPALVVAGVVRDASLATAEAVAARIDEAGCPVLAWIGSAPAAAGVLDAGVDPPTVVATSRVRTAEGLALAGPGQDVRAVCVCADVSLSLDPEMQRFVHDLQAESGSPPGAYTVEAYDAGRLLTGILDDAPLSRAAVAAGLRGVTRFVGLVDAYAFAPDGSRAPVPRDAVGRWRAVGSRWMPV
ncbi:MAG TPA: hypothetical protein VFZ75_06170 [Actinomycetota bacterium]|nr:hypothetical protein [Actinomycetota bacterium]